MRKKTISGVKWTTVSTVTVALAGLIKIGVLARFLDKSAFGLMALVVFVLGFLNLFMDMGLTTAILHKQEITKKEYASLYWINIGISFLLFGLAWVIGPLMAIFYEQPELSALIPLIAVSIIFSALGRQFKTIEQKRLNFRYLAIVDILGAVLGLVFGIILAVKGYGVYSLVYAMIMQYAVSYSIYFVRGIFKQGVLFHFNFVETKPFLRIGLYYTGGQLLNYVSRDLDILLIGKLLGADVLGAYSLAKQLVQKPSRIINPIITKVASPVLALSQENISKLKKQFMLFLNIISTANFTVYLLIALLASPIVRIVYGTDFMQIVIIVQILCAYGYIRGISNPVGSLIIATGRTDLGFLWNLFVLFVTPIAILIGSFYGIKGVAISMVLAMLVLFVPSWRFLIYKIAKASLREYTSALIPDFKRILKLAKANIG